MLSIENEGNCGSDYVKGLIEKWDVESGWQAWSHFQMEVEPFFGGTFSNGSGIIAHAVYSDSITCICDDKIIINNLIKQHVRLKYWCPRREYTFIGNLPGSHSSIKTTVLGYIPFEFIVNKAWKVTTVFTTVYTHASAIGGISDNVYINYP